MCTRPKTAYHLKPLYWQDKNKSPVPLLHAPHEPEKYEVLKLPCRNDCIECLAGHSSQRGLQLWAEAQTTTGDSWFLTLTFDDEYIPKGHSLDKSLPNLFYKKVRRYRERTNQSGKFRYEAKWEYGTTTYRPHGHVGAFNLYLPPDDLEVVQDLGNYKLYKSTILSDLWGRGDVVVTQLTQACATYIAAHDYKKIGLSPIHERDFYHQKTGELIPPPLLETIDTKTGEITMEPRRVEEYSTRSGKPGIGYEWFQKYGITDLWQDYMVSSSKQPQKMPKYFFDLIKKNAPDLYEVIHKNRIIYAKANIKNDAQNAYQEKFNTEMLKQKAKRNKI